jgi:NADH-quinone oxidoreductase subunit J
MMIRVDFYGDRRFSFRRWTPAVLLAGLFLILSALTVSEDTGAEIPLKSAVAIPKEFGLFLFRRYWLSVEIISLLLLIALVAAIQLGKGKGEEKGENV